MYRPCDYGMCNPDKCTDQDCIGEVENNIRTIKKGKEKENVQQEDNLHR